MKELVFARNLPHLLTESRGVVGYGVAETAVATNSLLHPSVPTSGSVLGCGERAGICEEFAAPSDRVARSRGARSS